MFGSHRGVDDLWRLLIVEFAQIIRRRFHSQEDTLQLDRHRSGRHISQQAVRSKDVDAIVGHRVV